MIMSGGLECRLCVRLIMLDMPGCGVPWRNSAWLLLATRHWQRCKEMDCPPGRWWMVLRRRWLCCSQPHAFGVFQELCQVYGFRRSLIWWLYCQPRLLQLQRRFPPLLRWSILFWRQVRCFWVYTIHCCLQSVGYTMLELPVSVTGRLVKYITL